MASRRGQLVGNRLALLGTVLYFMEWVVIPFAPSLPTDRLGHDPAATVAAYADHPGTTALLAGWLSVASRSARGFATPSARRHVNRRSRTGRSERWS